MDPDIEDRLKHSYLLRPERWFGISTLPLPLFPISAAHLLHLTAAHLQTNSPRLSDIWSDALVSVTSDAVESALPMSELTVQGIVDGCTEVVIADVLEKGFNAMMGFFRSQRERLTRQEQPARANEAIADLSADRETRGTGRKAMVVGAAQTAATIRAMDATDVLVRRVSPSSVRASIEVPTMTAWGR
jgi:hypothetical protein